MIERLHSLSFHRKIAGDEPRTRTHIIGVVLATSDGLAFEWTEERFARRRVHFRYRRAGRAGIQQALIPWLAIDSVRYNGSLLGAGRFELGTHTIGVVEALPGAHGAHWWAHVDKGERRRARAFANSVDEILMTRSRTVLRSPMLDSGELDQV